MREDRDLAHVWRKFNNRPRPLGKRLQRGFAWLCLALFIVAELGVIAFIGSTPMDRLELGGVLYVAACLGLLIGAMIRVVRGLEADL